MFSLAFPGECDYYAARSDYGSPQNDRRFRHPRDSTLRRRIAYMAKVMTKSQIVAHMADKCGTSKKGASMFFDELFKLAVKECKGGAGKFVIPGLGRCVKRNTKARMGRNPQTGEPIKIKAKTVVRMRPTGAFKKAVLGK
jgi:DNA-binding protein HU-beta